MMCENCDPDPVFYLTERLENLEKSFASKECSKCHGYGVLTRNYYNEYTCDCVKENIAIMMTWVEQRKEAQAKMKDIEDRISKEYD